MNDETTDDRRPTAITLAGQPTTLAGRCRLHHHSMLHNARLSAPTPTSRTQRQLCVAELLPRLLEPRQPLISAADLRRHCPHSVFVLYFSITGVRVLSKRVVERIPGPRDIDAGCGHLLIGTFSRFGAILGKCAHQREVAGARKTTINIQRWEGMLLPAAYPLPPHAKTKLFTLALAVFALAIEAKLIEHFTQ